MEGGAGGQSSRRGTLLDIDGTSASAGGTDRDLACSQFVKTLRTYNVIDFKHDQFKTRLNLIIFLNVCIEIIVS